MPFTCSFFVENRPRTIILAFKEWLILKIVESENYEIISNPLLEVSLPVLIFFEVRVTIKL
jgi:hypothetical protein